MDNQQNVVSRARPRGVVHIEVRDQFGHLKYVAHHSNVVVDAGLALIAERWGSATPSSESLINYIAVGTNATAPATTDVKLGTENARKQVLSRAYSGTTTAISTTFGAGEVPVSTIRELGLYIDGTGAADSGTLLAHVADNFAVGALDSVFVDWRLTLADA